MPQPAGVPLVPSTFRLDSIGGTGEIEFRTGGADGTPLAVDLAIPGNVEQLFAVPARLSKAHANLSSGKLGVGVTFAAAAQQRLDIVHPGRPSAFLATRGLESVVGKDQLGLHLSLSGNATVGAEGVLPVGPASFQFGIAAGGNVGYDRFLVADANLAAGLQFAAILQGMRLPHASGSPATIPAPGEILVFRYGGFLELSAALNWGYEIHGVEGFEFHDLDAALHYHLRVKAAVTAGYKLAGEYEIESRRGDGSSGDSGTWVRLIIRKARNRSFTFAAAFQAEGGYKLGGLAEAAEDWLATFLRADSLSVLKVLDEACTLASLDELEKRAGKLLMPSIRALSQKWLGKQLDTVSVRDFLDRVQRMTTAFQHADQHVVLQVLALYEDFLRDNRLNELRTVLLRVHGLSDRDALVRLEGQDPAWDVIQRLAGGDLFVLLESNELFAALQQVAERGIRFLDGDWLPDLKDLVELLQSHLRIDKLFGKLSEVSSKEKLLKLADEQLQGLVEGILGKTFEEIRTGKTSDSLKELRKALEGVKKFKETFAGKLKEAFEQSLALSVNYAYSRAASHLALLDMEFDVSQEAGRALFEDAVHGRFRGVFERADLACVRVHKAQLTHALSRTGHLQINAFGWSSKRLVEVLTQTSRSLEVQEGGLVQVFTTEAAIKQRREKNGSILETNFLLRLIGENLRDSTGLDAEAARRRSFLIKSLNHIAIRYDFRQVDQETTLQELRQYLELAELLGLVPDARRMSEELAAEFGVSASKKGATLGMVKVAYVVRFSPDSVRSIFLRFSDTEADPALSRVVRETARRVMAGHYTSMNADNNLARIGFAYLDREIAGLYARGNLVAQQEVHATMPAWFTGRSRDENVKLTHQQRHVLNTLFNIEHSLARHMAELDRLVDAAVASHHFIADSELERAARAFVKMGDNVDGFGGTNAFFAVVDRLIHEAEGGKGQRESAMILEITPPGGQTVRKYLMSGPTEVPAEVAIPAGR